ncbi:hypothetical protein WDU94_000179 [Cyamophila willieti]
MSSQKRPSKHCRHLSQSKEKLSLLQPSSHPHITIIVEDTHKDSTPGVPHIRKTSLSEPVQETNVQKCKNQEIDALHRSPSQTNVTITENESCPSDHRNHLGNDDGSLHQQKKSNILPKSTSPNDNNGLESHSFNCSNKNYLANIQLPLRTHGQALPMPEDAFPNTNNKSDVTNVTNTHPMRHSENCGVAETSDDVKDDQSTDDVTDVNAPLNPSNEQSNTNPFDVTDPHAPLNPNPSAVRLLGDIYGKVPTPVGPIEVRPSRNQLYYRKIHKYLLFRSDQHLLYRACILGISLYVWFTDLYWISIRRINVLEPDGSISYRNFHKIPIKDNTFCVTVFNITNLAEFYASYEKPVLQIQPVGPFCFR